MFAPPVATPGMRGPIARVDATRNEEEFLETTPASPWQFWAFLLMVLSPGIGLLLLMWFMSKAQSF